MDDTSTYGKGILVDWMTNSNIENCYTTGSITGGSYIEKYIGGIAGLLNGNIISVSAIPRLLLQEIMLELIMKKPLVVYNLWIVGIR